MSTNQTQAITELFENNRKDHKPLFIASWLHDCDSRRQLASKDGASTGMTLVQHSSRTTSLSSSATSAAINNHER